MPKTQMMCALGAALAALTCCMSAAEAPQRVTIDLAPQVEVDPVYADPVTIDPDHPPAIAELAFNSGEHRLNGVAYLANGPGPHPTVFMLHGFPGNEKSLDVAQALRRAGFNTVFFHYRGSWGSGGEFSFSNVIDDVAVAKAHVIEEAGPLRVDPGRIIYLGHSMGGWAALQAAARDSSIRCAGGLAAADFGASAARVEASPEAYLGFKRYGDYLADGPLAGTSGDALVDEVLDNRDVFSVQPLAPNLAGKRILLIAANSDEAVDVEQVHEPMSAAFAAQAGLDLTSVRLDGDHSFSWTREALIREVLAWADGCR
ncbi:MAG: alpha/beta fold hydrolase [Pseudomonadota bacterium]